LELVDLYKKQRDFLGMIPLLKKVVELDPDHAIALAQLGICYLRTTKYREAFNMLERARDCSLSDDSEYNSSEKRFLRKNLGKL